MTMPTYSFHVKTWGGFYNENFRKIHHLEPGDFFFPSAELRDAFIKERRSIQQELEMPAPCIALDLTEGYSCDTRTVVHRVIELKGEKYYSFHDLGVNYPFDAAKFYMKTKWYPGFNDYPAGRDVDYSEAKVVKEWITGAFDISEEY